MYTFGTISAGPGVPFFDLHSMYMSAYAERVGASGPGLPTVLTIVGTRDDGTSPTPYRFTFTTSDGDTKLTLVNMPADWYNLASVTFGFSVDDFQPSQAPPGQYPPYSRLYIDDLKHCNGIAQID
jgi:hypothetical protein